MGLICDYKSDVSLKRNPAFVFPKTRVLCILSDPKYYYLLKTTLTPPHQPLQLLY